MLVPGARKRTPKPMLNKSRLKRVKPDEEFRVFDAVSAAFTVSTPHEPDPAQGGTG